jgi:MFS family permease
MIMFAHLPWREARPRTPARQAAASLRRLAAALAAAACALVVLAAASPAMATTARVPNYGPSVPLSPTPAPVHTVTAGGMSGWQITLIALGAALVAATAAVLLDRARAGRRRATATTA